MGGDSRTVSVKGTQVIKYQALNPPCNTNSLPAHVFACFKASLKAELHPANSLGSLPHPGCGMSTGVPEALGSSVCSDLLGTNCRGHLGQGTSIWTVPSSQQSREGQPGTALSSLGQRGRQAATEATADPQATRAMGLAPFQAGFGTVCASSRKEERVFVLLLARRVFQGQSRVQHIPPDCSSRGNCSSWKRHLPPDASQTLPYIPTSTKRQLWISEKHQPLRRC